MALSEIRAAQRSHDMVPSDRPALTISTRPGSDRSIAIIVLAVLAGVSFLPVLLTPIPAMVDYPNHLARMYILSQSGTPNANPHYEVTDVEMEEDSRVERFA